mmetsp:Transcript_13917/g.20894  ORF Transcript_13917/g.20894 Transcript_13917/m.20894 type:complete len:302 (+) Transcript_13917:57-962(+)
MMRLIHVLQAIVIAFLLARRGLRKKSLSKSGALAAVVVAVLTWSAAPRFGLVLIAFYLSGSFVTKIGAKHKIKLDANATECGERNAWQVLSCSFPATLLALIYRISCGDDTLCTNNHCSNLQTAFVAFFACCAGDTFASELGILAKSVPFLVTAPWRCVPPGTNGGITIAGTLASILGGTFIGLVYGLFGFTLTRDSDCRVFPTICALSVLGSLAGFVGSLLDSIIGATCQQTLYDQNKNCIAAEDYGGNYTQNGVGNPHEIVSGRPWLSNHAVNLVSSVATAALGPRLFRVFLSRFFSVS